MNKELKNELISMAQKDSQFMEDLIENGELGTVEYHPQMKIIHQENARRLGEIIDEHGWPGKGLVGADGAKAVWYLVQHSVPNPELMKRCLPLLMTAVEQNEADPWCLAYLQDRLLTLAGKPQVYGTQHDIDEDGNAYPLPILDPESVDRLRNEVGLGPLAEATSRIQTKHTTSEGDR